MGHHDNYKIASRQAHDENNSPQARIVHHWDAVGGRLMDGAKHQKANANKFGSDDDGLNDSHEAKIIGHFGEVAALANVVKKDKK
ncbi:TPA: hypothetical protein ACH3X3_001056 [Trebouxia sp. C0006]